MRGRRARRAWGAVAAWMAFQLTLTSLPGGMLPRWPGWRIDWVAHFCLYFGLGALVARAASFEGWPPARLAVAWTAIAVFGALDELHEIPIPGRGAEWGDWTMDLLGAAAGLAVTTLVMRTRWAKLLA